jgi:hypothetical protein
LLVSLVLSSFLAAASNWLESIFPDVVAYLFYGLEFAVSFGVITVLFALMFKYLPDVKMRWKNVWIGAMLTSFLFILGKYGLSFYFGKAEPESVYGAAGSVVLLLLWVSYSSMIVFFGAEFTKQYAVHHDLKIAPTADAVKLKEGLDVNQKMKKQEGNQNIVDPTAGSNGNGHIKDGYVYKDEYQLKTSPGHAKKSHEKVSELELKVMEKIEETRKPKLLKMKSRKELQHEIARLERRLAIDSQDIKDDFKWTHIFGGLIPRVLKVKHNREKKMDLDYVLKNMARRHITQVKEEETILDKIKKLIHADHK